MRSKDRRAAPVEETMVQFMTDQLTAYFQVLGGLPAAISASKSDGSEIGLEQAIEFCVAAVGDAAAKGNRILFVGNGGSAAIASHLAVDFTKNGGFPAFALNDAAMLTCVANDFSYEQVFSRQIAWQTRAGDVAFIISSSGRSANILAAAAAAREGGLTTITLSGFGASNPLRQAGDLNFYLANDLYGFVEIGHLTICHAILDIAKGWRAEGASPRYVSYAAE